MTNDNNRQIGVVTDVTAELLTAKLYSKRREDVPNSTGHEHATTGRVGSYLLVKQGDTVLVDDPCYRIPLPHQRRRPVRGVPGRPACHFLPP